MPSRWRRSSGAAAASPGPEERERKQVQAELRRARDDLRDPATQHNEARHHPTVTSRLITAPDSSSEPRHAREDLRESPTQRLDQTQRMASPNATLGASSDRIGRWDGESSGVVQGRGGLQRTARHGARAVESTPAAAVPEPDEWLCEVITGDLQHAGTKSNVFLDLYGENGCVPGVHLNKNQEKFSRNSTVSVSLRLDNDNLGRLYKVRVTHDRSGTGPDWFLSRLVLTHVSGPNRIHDRLSAVFPNAEVSGHAESGDTAALKPLPTNIAGEHYVFDCDAWLTQYVPAREVPARGPYVDPTRLPKLVTYTVKTFTGEGQHKNGSGTDANVHVQVFGQLGDSGIRHLTHSDTHSDKFEAGHEDQFKFEAVHLGDLTKVVIGHDNSGSIRHQLKAKGDAGWFLDKVVVFDPTLPGDVEFPCDRWLATNKDDGKIERELVRSRVEKRATEKFTIETLTSKKGVKEGLGGPAWPWVMLVGSEGKTGKLALSAVEGKRAFRAGGRDAFTCHAEPVGDIKSVTVGYNPKEDDAAPWVPESVWVKPPDGTRTCWAIDGARAETGGKGWPNQRLLVGKDKADDQAAKEGAGNEKTGSVRRGRPHVIAITPSGLKVECWDTAEGPPRRRGKEPMDCWNRDFVPSRSRTKKKGGDGAAALKKAFDLLELSIKRGDDGLGFVVREVGKRGAVVGQVLVDGPAGDKLQVGDTIRSVNKRKTTEMTREELDTIISVAAQLDLEVLRPRAPAPKPSVALDGGTASLLPQENKAAAPASFSGRGASATFRDPDAVRRAKLGRKEREQVAHLRGLLLDVPAACRDEYRPLREKMARLSPAEKTEVFGMARQGSGHAHARAVWRRLLELEVAATERAVAELPDLHRKAEAAAAAVETAAHQHGHASQMLEAALEAEARASAVKREADDELIAHPENRELQKRAVNCGTTEASATARAGAARKAEKRRQAELDAARAALRDRQAAVQRASDANARLAALGGPKKSTDKGVDPGLKKALAAVVKAKRNLAHAESAQRAGAVKHASDAGVFPVAEAVQKAAAEVERANAALEKAGTVAARARAQAARQEAAADAANAPSATRRSTISGATTRAPRKMSQAALSKVADAILEVIGPFKADLLSIPDLHERMVDAGYRISEKEVAEALERCDTLRAMAETQRRRKKHNEAAVKNWEKTKRSQRKQSSEAVRSEKAARAKEARDLKIRSMARVHYNPWAAALGQGIRPTPGQPVEADGCHFVHAGPSQLPWDRAERRSLGGVSKQSWYHGAKQVADATSAMASYC